MTDRMILRARFSATKARSIPARSLRVCVVAMALGGPLAACGVDRVVTGSITPDDYRARHPVVLGNGIVSLDVYVEGVRLDAPMRARIVQFAADHAREGTGPIEVLLPQGVPQAGAAHAAMADVRNALLSGGARGSIAVGAYPADPARAAPIRLSYHAVRARVTTRCGEWPADLASGSSARGWENRPYWNMGCAYQTTFAAQVADPRDLVEPRAERPADVEMRRRAIEKVRAGNDPGTNWTTRNSSISSVGGGN